MVTRKTVGAMVAAEQRDDVGAVLRDREHRRFGGLVAEMGREQADEDAGGANADDRPAFGEEARQHDAGILAIVATMDDVGADDRGEALRQLGAAGGEGDDGRFQPQASSPR